MLIVYVVIELIDIIIVERFKYAMMTNNYHYHDGDDDGDDGDDGEDMEGEKIRVALIFARFPCFFFSHNEAFFSSFVLIRGSTLAMEMK